MPFLQRQSCVNKRPHNNGKMDVNISAWLIISDVTRGKPQLSEWLIFQGVELFTAGRGYLLNAALGTGWRLSARSEWRRILCFFGDFICFWFLRCNFHFKERKIRKGQRTSGLFLFGLVCFSLTHPFFKVPNSDIEFLVPRGEAEGKVFLTFSVISLVFYFFGVWKPCGDIIREFTRRDL